VKEGDSVTLSCDSRGHPDVSFSWLKNKQIEKSQQKSDLKLNNVKPEDSGEYYCETKNKHGTMNSNIIIIDVKCEFYVLMPTPINNLIFNEPRYVHIREFRMFLNPSSFK